MRPEAPEGSRPNLGRRPDPKPPEAKLTETSNMAANDAVDAGSPPPEINKQTEGSRSAKIQTDNFETLSGRRPHPDYIAKGPIISREMYDKWTPDLLGIPQTSRPVRSTRNPCPKYVDSASNMSCFMGSIAWSATKSEINELNSAIQSGHRKHI